MKSIEITDHVRSLSPKCIRHFEAQVYRNAVEKFIPKENQTHWMKQIEFRNDDPLKALLILMSPNMTSIDWEIHNTRGWGRWEDGNV